MRSSSVTMRLPLVFESIQDLASINGTAEVRIRICRVLHQVSALLDLTLLMKSVGVSSLAVVVLPSTHLLPATQDVFPIAGMNQSSALLPSRPTATSSTVASMRIIPPTRPWLSRKRFLAEHNYQHQPAPSQTPKELSKC